MQKEKFHVHAISQGLHNYYIILHKGSHKRHDNNLETSKLTQISLRVATRVNLSLVVVFARLLFQYGAENCKKGSQNLA